MNYITEEMFYDLGKPIMDHISKSRVVGLKRFRSYFGISPKICALSWHLIKRDLPTNYKPVHLLWALFFLKNYNTESVNRKFGECDEKTFREKIWMVIDKLAFLKVVVWENRKVNGKTGQTCFTSLDGVDCQINEPSPFSAKWFSHKFKSAGLRYEIGLCIRTGHIVWCNGGYPCGDWPDLRIAREHFVDFLDPNERTFADKGYNDAKFFILPTEANKNRHGRFMSRHETINKRMKQFKVLSTPFRHNLNRHKICFHSVLNLTQLAIKYEEPLFSVL